MHPFCEIRKRLVSQKSIKVLSKANAFILCFQFSRHVVCQLKINKSARQWDIVMGKYTQLK